MNLRTKEHQEDILSDLYDQYLDQGSSCCSAAILEANLDSGLARCADCEEHCQTFNEFIDSFVDYAEAE